MTAQTPPPIQEHAHPGPAVYIKVALILAVVTGIEVGIYYMNLSDHVLSGTLFFLSFIKFALVGLYFMHLKFDSRLFRRLFVTGMILAGAVYAAVLSMFFFRA